MRSYCHVCLFPLLLCRWTPITTCGHHHGDGLSRAWLTQAATSRHIVKHSQEQHEPRAGLAPPQAQSSDQHGGARKMAKRPKTSQTAINTAIQLVGIMSRFPLRTSRGPPSTLHLESVKFFKARGLTHERSTKYCS